MTDTAMLGITGTAGALVVQFVFSVVLLRRIDRMRAQMEAGPLGYLECDARDGADVVMCPHCVFTIDWAPGRGKVPYYRDEVTAFFGTSADARCYNCQAGLERGNP